MNQETINIIVSYLPAISSVATIIIGGVKVLKTVKDANIKNNIVVENIKEQLNTLANKNSDLENANKELITTINHLNKEIANNKDIYANLNALKSSVINMSNSIENAVYERLDKAANDLAKIKRDYERVGEIHEEPSNEESNQEA